MQITPSIYQLQTFLGNTGMFVLEAIVKIIILNMHYFKKAWNVSTSSLQSALLQLLATEKLLNV